MIYLKLMQISKNNYLYWLDYRSSTGFVLVVRVCAEHRIRTRSDLVDRLECFGRSFELFPRKPPQHSAR